ncbi:MAG: hypothetical protein SGARI_000970 [Bacillariaceae sp.]
MNWFGGGGGMRRAVVNGAKPHIKRMQTFVKQQLIQVYGYAADAFPLYPVGGVELGLCFYRRLPNTAFQQRNRNNPFVGGRYGPGQSWPDGMKPDNDNLIKFVCDALIGIVYADDEQVIKIISYKLMDTVAPHEGRTQISFRRSREIPVNPLDGMM